MPDTLIAEDLLILRLADGDTPAAFQTRIEAQVGALGGELLSWLDGPWCYLSGGNAAELAARAPGVPLETLCTAAGAAEADLVPFAEFEARLRQRAVGMPFLRDAAVAPIVLPGMADTSTLDWQLRVSGIAAAWAQFDPTPGKLPWADIRVGHLDTGCTRIAALGFSGQTSAYVRADLGLNLFRDVLTVPDGGFSNDEPEELGPFDNLSGAFGGHGTRTLSVLTGFRASADDGRPFYGAAPGLFAIPYRVTNSILIDHAQRLIVTAIDDAIGKGCRVISMSLGGVVPTRRLAGAIDRAYEAGVIVCAAAGNVIREVTYPGRYNRVLTVGGVSPAANDGFTPWKNASRGPYVDICGPADGVRRPSVIRRQGALHEIIKENGNGTSYATALCAGIAAMWLAKRGNDLQAAYGAPGWRWPAAFKQLIKATANCPGDWDTGNWGRGVYQADRLLATDLPAAGALHREKAAGDAFDADA